MVFQRAIFAAFVVFQITAMAQTAEVEHRIQLQRHDRIKAEFQWKYHGLNPRGFDAFVMSLYQDLENAKFPAYEARKPYNNRLSLAETVNKLTDTVEIYIDDPDDPWNDPILSKVIEEKWESDIQAVTFNERWNANFSDGTFSKKVDGMLIHHQMLHPTGSDYIEVTPVYIKLKPEAAQGNDKGELVAYEFHVRKQVKNINHGLSFAEAYGKVIGKEGVKWENMHFIERWYINWATQRMTKEVLSVWFTKGKMAGEVLHMNGYNPVLKAEDVKLSQMQFNQMAYISGSAWKDWKNYEIVVDSLMWKEFAGPAVFKKKGEWNFRVPAPNMWDADYNKEYANNEFDRLFLKIDTVEGYVYDDQGEPMPELMVIRDSIAPEDINGILANGEATINLARGTFKVEVSSYTLTRCRAEDGPDYTKIDMLAKVLNDKLATGKKTAEIKVVRKHRIMPDLLYKPQGDWNTEEYEPYYGERPSYFETHWDAELRYRIIQPLLNAVEKGEVEIYPVDQSDKPKKIKKKVMRSMIEIPGPAVSEVDKKMRLVNYHDVAWLNLHETWTIDHATGNIKIYVTGVEPEIRWKVGPKEWETRKLFYLPLNGDQN